MTKVTGRPATGAAGSMCIRTVMPLAVFDQLLAGGFRGAGGMGSGGKTGGGGDVATTGGIVVVARPGSVGDGDGARVVVTVTGTVRVGEGATVDVGATVGVVGGSSS